MIPRSLLLARVNRVACPRRGAAPSFWMPRAGTSTSFDCPRQHQHQRQRQRFHGTSSISTGYPCSGAEPQMRSIHTSCIRCDAGRKSVDDDDLHDVSSTAAALAYGSLRKQGTIRNLRLQPKPKPKQTQSPPDQSSDDSWTREALAQRGGPTSSAPPSEAPSPSQASAASSSPESSEPPAPPPDRAEDLLKLRSLEQADKSSPKATSSSSDATDPQMIIDLPPPKSKKGEASAKNSEAGTKKSEGKKGDATGSSTTSTNETTPPSPRTPAVSVPGVGWAEYLREAHQLLTPVAHLVDTHAFVQRLLQHGWDTAGKDKVQSEEVAQALAEAVEEMLVQRLNQTRHGHISSVDVEYEFFVFRLALNEVKTELEVRARNDGASLRSMTQTLQREVDRLGQKVREDVDNMNHLIQEAMNESKTEVKGQQNDQEQTVQDLKHKLTIVVSTLKTGLEHSLKWDLSRRAFLLLFGQICFFFTIFKLIMPEKEKKVVAPKQAPMANRPQSAEDIGLVPHYERSGALGA